MAVTTYQGRARRALLHKQNSTYWCVLGRTTAWTNEAVPPDPSASATAIEEPIVYMQPSLVSLCKTVSSGADITFYGQGYAYVTEENAIAEQARFLYLKTEFDPVTYVGMPYAEYRQVAIYSDLTPATGHEADTWLAPASVSDEGLMEYLSHDVVTAMASNRVSVVEILIEFR